LTIDEAGAIMIAKIKMNSLVGTNCWLPHRFCGGRCSRVMACDYPEKKDCKAVNAEIRYLKDRANEVAKSYEVRIEELKKSAQKKIDKLEATSEKDTI
jgi:hypothetical protein